MNNFLKKACNSARRERINKISEDLKSSGNPKSFWSFVSSVRKGSNKLTALKVDDVTLTDDLTIVCETVPYLFVTGLKHDCLIYENTKEA